MRQLPHIQLKPVVDLASALIRFANTHIWFFGPLIAFCADWISGRLDTLPFLSGSYLPVIVALLIPVNEELWKPVAQCEFIILIAFLAKSTLVQEKESMFLVYGSLFLVYGFLFCVCSLIIYLRWPFRTRSG